jgi:hypothetical protein
VDATWALAVAGGESSTSGAAPAGTDAAATTAAKQAQRIARRAVGR